jgi:hypothetical protein
MEGALRGRTGGAGCRLEGPKTQSAVDAAATTGQSVRVVDVT